VAKPARRHLALDIDIRIIDFLRRRGSPMTNFIEVLQDDETAL
jgi:hypothetical protein